MTDLFDLPFEEEDDDPLQDAPPEHRVSDDPAPSRTRAPEPSAPGPLPRRVLTVTELTVRVRDLLEQEFFEVWVEGQDHFINEIGVGESIGEIGFFSGAPRTATIVAARDSVVLELDRPSFNAVARAVPAIYQTLLGALARRLAENSARIDHSPRVGVARTAAVITGGRQSRPLSSRICIASSRAAARASCSTMRACASISLAMTRTTPMYRAGSMRSRTRTSSSSFCASRH